ncbi:hypothetical protein BGX30_011575 [Mortierella sp. GBA39]|nr:hypothetical protein BGX30_011575 [Mortierella sp. GBA39]
MSDRHPSCIHSTGHHNSMTQGSAASACTCEECSRYKVMPVSYEQFSAPNDLEQQHFSVSVSSNTDSRRDPSSTSTSSFPPQTTYLTRRSSNIQTSSSGNQSGDTATSPRTRQPAGFGSRTNASGISPPQRRSSLEFHNRERSFQQHSTACDCGGSGVGCGCSYTCNC